MEAFLDGMERARVAGHDLTKMASVASFFVSRVDTEIDKRLDKSGTEDGKALRGKAAIANARLAFEAYEKMLASPRWQALAEAGARPQRPLWASTGVKDPAYDDTQYVVELVTRGVVNTMPEATLDAVADHGEIRGDTVRGEYANAHKVLADLAAAGIDYDDVVRVLEEEAVEKFETVVDGAARVGRRGAEAPRQGGGRVSPGSGDALGTGQVSVSTPDAENDLAALQRCGGGG